MHFYIKKHRVLIDKEDLPLLDEYNWFVGCGYVVANKKVNGKWTQVKMHRLINNTPAGYDTDHINGDTLDNRRLNLRSATRSENCQNVPKRQNATSRHKGVTWKKTHNKWVAKIAKNKKQIFLGHFDNEEKAAMAYNKAALKLFGKNAYVNTILKP